MKSKLIQVCVMVFFYVLSDNLLSDVSTPEDANAVVPLASISLNDLPEDTLIARVLEQKIYLKDINPSQAEIDKYASDKTPQQLEQWRRQQRTSTLSHYFRTLFERYIQQKNIQVTETEIDQHHQKMRRTMTQQREKAQKKVDSLQKELQADNLDEKKRSELTGRLEIYTKAVSNFEHFNKLEADAAASEERAKIRNAVAEQWICQWKINGALYKQYGGRVIFQQAGPEPLDAYRKFFEDQQRQGNFEFFNKEAEGLFWEYYRNEKMHASWVYSDETEARKIMDTPPWLREPDEPLEWDDADLWVEAADGLCMKIRTKKLVFNTQETAIVLVDLLNIGDKEFSIASLPQFFEIEVDGQWYGWCGPEASDILSFPLSPKKIQYEFAQIKLIGEWESKETAKPLKLDEGQHSLRLRYRPMYVKGDRNDKPVKTAIEVTSNLVKFKVVPFEEPLSIVLEGQRETIDRVGQWLARNPKIVRPVLGQSYRARMRPLNPQNNKAMTDAANSTDMSFTLKILDSSGNRMSPELEEKLAELIRKQLQEELRKP